MTAVEKLFYRTQEVKALFSIGQTTLYEWLNDGLLVGVKIGHETRITAASVKERAAALPKLTTPTMAKAALASGQPSTLKASIEGRAGRDALAKNRAAAKAAKASAKASRPYKAIRQPTAAE
jgi:hypothetical protein